MLRDVSIVSVNNVKVEETFLSAFIKQEATAVGNLIGSSPTRRSHWIWTRELCLFDYEQTIGFTVYDGIERRLCKECLFPKLILLRFRCNSGALLDRNVTKTWGPSDRSSLLNDGRLSGRTSLISPSYGTTKRLFSRACPDKCLLIMFLRPFVAICCRFCVRDLISLAIVTRLLISTAI